MRTHPCSSVARAFSPVPERPALFNGREHLMGCGRAIPPLGERTGELYRAPILPAQGELRPTLGSWSLSMRSCGGPLPINGQSGPGALKHCIPGIEQSDRTGAQLVNRSHDFELTTLQFVLESRHGT